VIELLADTLVWAWSWSLVRIGAVLGAVLTTVPFIIVFERKVIGWVQNRPGPNRVGPWGLLQGFVDGGKLFFKETIKPNEIDALLYYIAPFFSIVPAMILLCVMPFAPDGVDFLTAEATQITIAANHDLGILLYFAISSLGVYGLVLAGWASGNKYSLLGGIRSSAQMVSYELSLALAAVGVLILSGTLNLQGIVAAQVAPDGGPWYSANINLWHWNIWSQPIAFVVFLIAAFAETNRLPFDLPEAESELTGGYHTEYSSMKFAMFFLAEYIHMITISALIVTLFLGGWSNPFLQGPADFGFLGLQLGWLLDHLVFVFKVGVFMFFFMYIRATLPRLRYDQLMNWGWKWMLPIALGNVVLTAFAKLLFSGVWLVLFLLITNILVVAFFELISWIRLPVSEERRRGFRYVT
jgi:NADH-quinone oxidoreductase subunit H